MSYLKAVSDSLYKQAVEEYGEEEARKIWAHAVDPVTGYVSRGLNQVHALDGSIPCVEKCK